MLRAAGFPPVSREAAISSLSSRPWLKLRREKPIQWREGSGMRVLITIVTILLLCQGLARAEPAGTVNVRRGVTSDVTPSILSAGADCVVGTYYMLDECGYACVVEGIGANQTFGVCFSMTEPNPLHSSCDTAACLRLDMVELVFYDVLSPPADQNMNLKVFAADAQGNPVGDLLGNRDFVPAYLDTAAFTSVQIDFTNGGSEPGLDLSGCGGCFVALLTWKNPTGHPCLALDNIGSCVAACGTNSACCEMGTPPYVYPRNRTHTYYYGAEGSWAKQDSICDPGGCEAYGHLEAIWSCGFCVVGAATQPTTWGAIKATYR